VCGTTHIVAVRRQMVKEAVELYLCFLAGPSLPATGCTDPWAALLYTFMFIVLKRTSNIVGRFQAL